MNILVIPPFSAAQKAVLEAGAPGAAFTYAEACDVSDKQVAVADVIVGNLPAEQLAQARRLRLLQLNSAGYDAYMAPGTVPACERPALGCAEHPHHAACRRPVPPLHGARQHRAHRRREPPSPCGGRAAAQRGRAAVTIACFRVTGPSGRSR